MTSSSDRPLSADQRPDEDAAFPIVPPMDGGQPAPGYYCQQYGLTKRELFAAMMVQGMLAAGTGDNRYDRAHDAVAHADALLEVLGK